MSVRETDRVREHVDALQQQVTELKNSADQAREETSEQVKARVEQVKADIAASRESAGETAWQAAERVLSGLARKFVGGSDQAARAWDWVLSWASMRCSRSSRSVRVNFQLNGLAMAL